MKIHDVELHPSVTGERVLETADPFRPFDNGICISCGADVEEVEPDAERYKCPQCGQHTVYGGEQLVLYMAE
jgi:predicted amidophosphoribosyltransferase